MNELTLAAKIIAWLVAIWLARSVVYAFVGSLVMCAYFPEGNRWWMPLARIGSLVLFAVIVMANPFVTWSLK